MNTNQFKKVFLLALTFFLFATLTLFAQPQKDRGAGNKTQKPAQPSATPPATSNSSQKDKKKIVVILDFDDGTNTVESQKRPVGRQVAIMLSNEFTLGGNFTVVEREQIQEVIKKQNETRIDRFDPVFAAKIGKLVSAQTVVLGTIIEYTTKRVTKGLPGYKKVTLSAKVGAVIRLVSVNTGEVLDSVTVNGSSEDVSSATVFSSKDTELSEEVKTSLLTAAAGDAAKKAAEQLTKLIDKSLISDTSVANKTVSSNTTGSEKSAESAKTEEKKEKKSGGFLGIGGKKDKKSEEKNKTDASPVPANTNTSANTTTNVPRIALIDGQDVYVRNLPAGTKVGTKLIAYEIGKVLKDETTGEILKQEEKIIAELEVVSITDTSLICKILSGSNLTTKALIRIAK